MMARDVGCKKAANVFSSTPNRIFFKEPPPPRKMTLQEISYINSHSGLPTRNLRKNPAASGGQTILRLLIRRRRYFSSPSLFPQGLRDINPVKIKNSF